MSPLWGGECRKIKKIAAPDNHAQQFNPSPYIMQLVTPSVVAMAVAIDTISWIISFQVFFFVSVLIRKIFFLLNIIFLEVRGEG